MYVSGVFRQGPKLGYGSSAKQDLGHTYESFLSVPPSLYSSHSSKFGPLQQSAKCNAMENNRSFLTPLPRDSCIKTTVKTVSCKMLNVFA